jgi:hypothetical protein
MCIFVFDRKKWASKSDITTREVKHFQEYSAMYIDLYTYSFISCQESVNYLQSVIFVM